jgi:hypothetical protein
VTPCGDLFEDAIFRDALHFGNTSDRVLCERKLLLVAAFLQQLHLSGTVNLATIGNASWRLGLASVRSPPLFFFIAILFGRAPLVFQQNGCGTVTRTNSGSV